MDLQSIACPVKGLGLVGDHDTGLSNDIHSSQVAWKKIFQVQKQPGGIQATQGLIWHSLINLDESTIVRSTGNTSLMITVQHLGTHIVAIYM